MSPQDLVWILVAAELLGFMLVVSARDYSIRHERLRLEIHRLFGSTDSIFVNPKTPASFQCFPHTPRPQSIYFISRRKPRSLANSKTVDKVLQDPTPCAHG